MTTLTIIFLFTTFLLTFARWLWSRRRFYSVYMKLPGPLGLPLIGMGLQLKNPEKFLSYANEESKKYKSPFISWMGPKCFLFVNDPETVETIFQSSACTNKGDMYHFIADIIGDGLFTSSSPRWNKHRRLMNPAFGRKTVETFLPIFNAEVDVLLNKLIESSNQSMELYELLKKTVLETACQTTMGQKMNFQNDQSTEIFNAYTSLLDTFIKRLLSPWLYPDVIYRFSQAMESQRNTADILYRFVENLINNPKDTTAATRAEKSVASDDPLSYMKESGNSDIKKSKSRTFIDCVRGYVQTGQLTIEDVRDEANVAMAASFETTSTALYFVFLCLAIHPEKQNLLYHELATIFPNSDEEMQVTLQDLENMPYTEMVINEAMRLFSPVPMVLRSASADFPLRDGTIIPQGTQIAIDIYNMQRNETFWGPEALSFDPEAHFGPHSPHHPYAFVPFTKGLRMCIGYRYALMLMKVVVAKIFRQFRVHTDVQLCDLQVVGTISLKLLHYPLCKFLPRKVK